METRKPHTAKVALAFAALSLLLAGCLKTEKFPVEPAISLEGFGYVGDSLTLSINFTDGDGDIGLGQDTYLEAPFNDGSFYYNNLHCDAEKLVNGVWVDQGLPYHYRTRVLTPDGQNKALEGRIDLVFSGIIIPPLFLNDTVRMRVRLWDRALHESNTLVTPGVKLR